VWYGGIDSTGVAWLNLWAAELKLQLQGPWRTHIGAKPTSGQLNSARGGRQVEQILGTEQRLLKLLVLEATRRAAISTRRAFTYYEIRLSMSTDWRSFESAKVDVNYLIKKCFSTWLSRARRGQEP
jgi:hypothetical protein